MFGISKSRVHAPEEKVETLELTTKFDRFDFVGTRKKFYVISAVLLISWCHYARYIQVESRY